jgi:restriction system protein
MKGWIFGCSNQKQWTQQIYKFKSKFQNPLHQNYKHVRTLEDLLLIGSNAKNNSIFSVIIFIGESTFKTKMPDNVRFARGGIEYIKSKTDVAFNSDEVTNIIEQIESGRLVRGTKTNRHHVKHVQEIIENKSDYKPCSKCGSNMVQSKAKKDKH